MAVHGAAAASVETAIFAPLPHVAPGADAPNTTLPHFITLLQSEIQECPSYSGYSKYFI